MNNIILLINLIVLCFLQSCKYQETQVVPEVLKNKKLILTPHINNNKVVFSYHGDLYFIYLSDSNHIAKKIHCIDGFKLFPKISPDGRKIVFTRVKDRQSHLYLYFFQNDSTCQLTYVPEFEIAQDWSMNSDKILFSSSFRGMSNSISGLYEINITKNSTPTSLGLEGGAGCYGLNGELLFNRYPINNWRAGYRGGKVNEIWELNNHSSISKIIQNNAISFIYPMPAIDGSIYCLGDCDNVWNLFTFKNPLDRNSFTQATFNTRNIYYPSISRDGKYICYEYDGGLEIYDTKLREVSKIPLTFEEESHRTDTVKYNIETDWDEVQLSTDNERIYYIMNNSLFSGTVSNSEINVSNIDWYQTVNGSISSLALSSSGEYLAFIERYKSNDDILILDLQKQCVAKRIEDYVFKKSRLCWTTSSEKLIWQSKVKGLVIYNLSNDSSKCLYKERERPLENIMASKTDDSFIFTDSPNGISKAFQCSFEQEQSKISLLINSPFNETYPTYFYNSSQKYFLLTDNCKGLYNLIFVSKKKSRKNKVSVLLKNENNLRKPLSASNKLFFLSNYNLRCIDFSRSIDTIVLKDITNYEMTQGEKILACDSQGLLNMVDIRTLKSSPLRVSKPIYTYSKQFSRKKKIIFDHSWRTIQDHIYDSSFIDNKWQNYYEYFNSYVNDIQDYLELRILLYRLIGKLNVSHISFGPPNPFFLMNGSISPLDLCGVELVYNTKSRRYSISQKLSSDPYSLSSHFLKLDLLKVGDELISLNCEYPSSMENIYKYFYSPNSTTKLFFKCDKDIKVEINSNRKNNDINGRSNWIQNNKDFVSRRSKGAIGYVYLPKLTEKEVEIWDNYMLEYNDIDKIIIDLRYCSGGSSDAMLLKEIASRDYGFTIDRRKNKQNRPKVYNKKFLLLVNGYTRSAGEIFARAFQTFNLGDMIGTKTAGECLTSKKFDIDNSIYCYIPTKVYFDNIGCRIENIGVTPELIVENNPKSLYEINEDKQLLKAIQVLSQNEYY